MRAVIGHDKAIAEWAAEQMGLPNGFLPPVTAIGFVNAEGVLSGAIVFNAFTGIDVEMGVAGRGAVSREAFRLAAEYALALGCVRVTASARADNERSIRIIEWGGFKREGVARKRYGDCDGIMFGITAEEIRDRWLNDGK